MSKQRLRVEDALASWCSVQVPFGEVSVVNNWLKISGVVYKPNPEHPSRPVDGFGCTRSEVLTLTLLFHISDVPANLLNFRYI